MWKLYFHLYRWRSVDGASSVLAFNFDLKTFEKAFLRHLCLKYQTRSTKTSKMISSLRRILSISFIHNIQIDFFAIFSQRATLLLCEWTISEPIFRYRVWVCNIVAIVTTYYFRMSHLRRIFRLFINCFPFLFFGFFRKENQNECNLLV